MNSFFQTLAFTYLLYPILGLLLVGLGIFIAKKNALLNNKRLVGYTIGAIAILTLPALLGFLDYGFMPYGYIFLAMLYLFLGSYNIRMISWVYKDDYKYRHEIILTGFILVVSMLFFTLVFNLCNELKYGLWASTCLLPFSFPLLYAQTVVIIDEKNNVKKIIFFQKSVDNILCIIFTAVIYNYPFKAFIGLFFQTFKNSWKSFCTIIGWGKYSYFNITHN